MGDKIVHPKKRAFLAAYANCGTVTQAAVLVDIRRATHYDWLKEDEAYVEAFASAKEEAGEWLEAEARRRAAEGVNEPVIYQGKLQGVWVDEEGKQVADGTNGASLIPLTIKKYSDTLLIFLLKGAMPAKYRERHEITVDHVALRSEAERIAKENDLPIEEVVAEAERIAKGIE